MLQRQPRARRLGQSVIGIEKVVRPERFELPTLWFEVRSSFCGPYVFKRVEHCCVGQVMVVGLS